MKITDKQSVLLLRHINRVTGKTYAWLSHVAEDGIGKRANKVRGISKEEASLLIDEWSKKPNFKEAQ